MSRTCSLYASMSGPMKTFRDSRVYTAVPLQTVQPISTQALGEPAARIFINLLDFSATLVSVGCFAAAALVINPNHYAAKLGFYNQIIILGFRIELQEGKCDPKPLSISHQLYDNDQFALASHLIVSLSEYLSEFSSTRNSSH